MDMKYDIDLDRIVEIYVLDCSFKGLVRVTIGAGILIRKVHREARARVHLISSQ